MRRLRALAWQDRVALACLAAAFLASALLYSRLPDRVPVQFGLAGEPRRWTGRLDGAFGGPALVAGVWLVTRLRGGRQLGLVHASTSRTLSMCLVVLLCTAHALALRSAFGAPFPGSTLVAMLAGLWIVLGLGLPRLRRNRFIGIRTPASLRSDEAWERTHRLASATCVLTGLVALPLSAVSAPAALAALVTGVVVPALLSFPIARTSP